MERQERLVGGRYRLVARLGTGGMGTVWRAEDVLLGREVAVKEVALPAGGSAEQAAVLRERTRREARAAARLDHPSAVTVYDVVEEDGRAWLVMELLDARTLAEVVSADGPLSPVRTAEVGLALLGALQTAHARGIVHRDVKPGNVLLCTDGRVVLTDFGIATSTGDAALTSTGLLLGSPAYIAPERARGLPPEPASDLWSLGATLFTAVEGRPPYDAANPVLTVTAVVTGEHAPFAAAGPLEDVLDGLLEKDPRRRLTATAATARLLRIVSWDDETWGDPVTVARPRPEAPVGPRAGRTTALPVDRVRARIAHVDPPPTDPPATDPLPVAVPRAERPPAHPRLRRAPDEAAAPPSRQTGARRARSGPELRDTPDGAAQPPPAQPPPAQPRPARVDAAGPRPPRLETPPRSRPRRGRRVAVLAALLVLPFAAGAGYALTRTDDASSARTPAAPAAAEPTAPREEATAPVAEPTAPVQDGLPAGWSSYTDPTEGWTVGVPPGYERSAFREQVQFRNQEQRRTLRIDYTASPGPSALQAWQDLSAQLAQVLDDYEQLSLTRVDHRGLDAADLEFRYTSRGTRLHVVDRGIVAGGTAQALYWQVRAEDFAASRPVFEQIAASFRSPG